jgi:hypothetical protein
LVASLGKLSLNFLRLEMVWHVHSHHSRLVR